MAGGKVWFHCSEKAVDYFQKLPKSLRENEVLRSRMLGVGDMTDIMNTIIMIAENHSPSLLHPELDQESTTSTTPGETNKIDVVLAPPTEECFECGRSLAFNHTSSVKVYSLESAAIGKKLTLRCKKCDLYYNLAMYGNKSNDGFRYYDTPQDFIEASDTIYFKRNLIEFQCSLANHAWTTFQGFAESYNDAHNLSKEMEMKAECCANSFYNGELELELRRIKRLDYSFRKDSDREKCMKMVENYRRENLYPHLDCTAECRARGCRELWVTDGVWKLSFPHCMYKVEVTVKGIPTLNLPDVCTKSPMPGKAFCHDHCALLQSTAPDVPTDLRKFLKYAGALNVEDSVEGMSQSNVETVKRVETAINKLPCNTVEGKSAAHAQGIDSLISNHPDIAINAVVVDDEERLCRKDTGLSARLRKWSRGHQFIVRGGGHIDTWQPLYKSESPSQVFLILVNWLLSLKKTTSLTSNSSVILAYDNMCNLQKMKAAKHPLPLPPPEKQLWANVTKIIDVFHFRNHVSPVCRDNFSPKAVKDQNPNYNTQAGEQTFVWLGRYKNSLCSMTKEHHLFYLHRMIVRRNAYTSKCYRFGKKPLLPKK